MGNGRINQSPFKNKVEEKIEKVFAFLKKDIDFEYYDLLSRALEFGMSVNEFWESEINIYYSYERAYINRLHREKHIQGLYNNLAFSVTLSNAFRKKGAKEIQYPKEDIYNPFKQSEKQKEKVEIKKLKAKDLFQLKKQLKKEERRNK